MTVHELQQLLHELPKDAIVILSQDAEGNMYTPLDEIVPDVRYIPNGFKGGDIEVEGHEGEKAIVLFPL